MEYKKCKTCMEENPLTIEFFIYCKRKNGTFFWKKDCKDCFNKKNRLKNRKYREKNRKKLADKQKIYYENNKEACVKTKRQCYLNNKEHYSGKAKTWLANKRKNDSFFKLRESISAAIRNVIIKNKKSFIKFIDYSLDELKIHLEKQFKDWMTWENHGVYRVDTWDDNDKSTWTWQLDHIIPHSNFKYSSMEDQSFRNCWALSNLRPLSAKQNVLDGNRR